MKQAFDAALQTSDANTEILLINNHPPYPDMRHFLKLLKIPRVRVLDPGHNLGCTQGFQYGASKARGQYLVKLDDDTIVPPKNWLATMCLALQEFPDLAYVGLALPIYKLGRFPQIDRGRYILEFYDDVVNFACMMIRRNLWQAHFQITHPLLYGDEETFYHNQAKRLGLRKGYLVSHSCQHLARTAGSDPFYGAWKIFYLAGKTKVDFKQWRRDFRIGAEEMAVFRGFNYPEEQIRLLKSLLGQR